LARAEGFAARIDDRFGLIESGLEVTIGVRPHDLRLRSGAEEKVADLHVELVEVLGSEAFVHGSLSAPASRGNVIARLEAREARDVRPGAVIPLAADPSAIHLFDESSGRSLAK
jgi:ABC-type sugar transport system ATPase subunit